MKFMQLPLAAIFFMTYFYRAEGRAWLLRNRSPGSTTGRIAGKLKTNRACPELEIKPNLSSMVS